MVTTELCGVALENPTILASGILGVTASSLKRVADAGAGAVTMKSVGAEKRLGHKNPTMVEVTGGWLNAMGLPSPGPESAIKEIHDYKKRCGTPLIASFHASTAAGFGPLAKRISEGMGPGTGPDLLEANISCPNVESEFGTPFSADVKKAAQVVKAVKSATKGLEVPLLVKLSPNVPSIAAIAKAVEKAGADGITAINTLGPGMVIDLKTRKPVLENKAGGMSGPAVKPIAVRCVYDIYEAVKIPIVGVGGVDNGEDAAEMIMAGATAVGIGSGVAYRGINVFKEVAGELDRFMKQEGFKSLKEMRGIAHKE